MVSLWVEGLIPDRGGRYTHPETSTLGQGTALIPHSNWDRLPPILIETMMSIKALQRTAPAVRPAERCSLSRRPGR